MSLRQMHVVALLAVLLTAGPALAQGRWSQMKPIPQGEEEVIGVALDGRMYVLGGLGACYSTPELRPCSPRATTTAPRESTAGFTSAAAASARPSSSACPPMP